MAEIWANFRTISEKSIGKLREWKSNFNETKREQLERPGTNPTNRIHSLKTAGFFFRLNRSSGLRTTRERIRVVPAGFHKTNRRFYEKAIIYILVNNGRGSDHAFVTVRDSSSHGAVQRG